MKLNKKKAVVSTHEGAPAKRISYEDQLKRSVLSCLLWENEFYEDGKSIADRIYGLVQKVSPTFAAVLALEARHKYYLRHASLWIVNALFDHPSRKDITMSEVVYDVVSRPDEICELIAMYWYKRPGAKLPAALKKGIAKAFHKFDEYQLAKWNRKGVEVTLKDAMCLCHPKPATAEQGAMWKRLLENKLKTPDTWEVRLSARGNNVKDWEELLAEGKLGGLALLRNLRNMYKAGVPEKVIEEAICKNQFRYVLPFRFIAAAKYVPQLEPVLEEAMLRAVDGKLPGHTALLVDVSDSMNVPLSCKSDLTRMEAACGLAILLREICEKITIITFSRKLVIVPPRRGFALRDAIVNSQEHSSTYLGAAVWSLWADRTETKRIRGYFRGYLNFRGLGVYPDRVIAITDEQSHDPVPDPKSIGYMINVASYERGVGYGPWNHIDGFSEAVVNWITEIENEFSM